MSATSSSAQAVNAAIGSASLIGGFVLAGTVVAVRLDGLGNLPTGLIRNNPVMMLGLAVLLILAGARLLWELRQVRTIWSPTQRGRRFDRVALYTKPGCLLCEEAVHVLRAYRPYLPDVQTIDVSTDPALQSRYGGCVPVVEIDGRKRFTGQINEVLLRRLIEGTPPHAPT
jgi:hypothetical protein